MVIIQDSYHNLWAVLLPLSGISAGVAFPQAAFICAFLKMFKALS